MFVNTSYTKLFWDYSTALNETIFFPQIIVLNWTEFQILEVLLFFKIINLSLIHEGIPQRKKDFCFFFIALLETSLKDKHLQSSVLTWALYGSQHIHFHSDTMRLSFTVGHKSGHLIIQLNQRSWVQGKNNKSNPSDYIKRHSRSKWFHFQRQYYRIHKISNIDLEEQLFLILLICSGAVKRSCYHMLVSSLLFFAAIWEEVLHRLSDTLIIFMHHN